MLRAGGGRTGRGTADADGETDKNEYGYEYDRERAGSWLRHHSQQEAQGSRRTDAGTTGRPRETSGLPAPW